MVKRVMAWSAAGGVAVGAGVVEQGGGGAGGVAGEGGPDGDLAEVVAVEDRDVERGQQAFLDPVGGGGEHGAGDGQRVEQAGVFVVRGGGVEGAELGFGAGALVVQPRRSRRGSWPGMPGWPG